jgi:ABC-type Fe3+ transport system permease subunit
MGAVAAHGNAGLCPIAYTYTDFLQFVGPVQTGLRETFGWQKDDYWFPEVRSLGGAIVLFSCVLYPLCLSVGPNRLS